MTLASRLLRVAAGAAVVVVALLIAAFGYRAWRQHDNALAYAITAPQGVEEASFVPIGAIDQWIAIRGEDRANPVLLYLHGGPGRSSTPLAPALRSWEKHFTVVMWDQRGAGKTFGRNGTDEQPMTVARMVDDGIEVTEYLRRHLDKKTIVLLGHSWGTELGVLMAKQRPDLFSAYVGTGQVVSIAEKEPYSLEAPHKVFAVIPGGGHSAVLTMPDEFLKLLLRDVRPVALAAG